MISRGGGGAIWGLGEEMRLSGLYGCYLFVFARYLLEDKVTVCRFSHPPNPDSTLWQLFFFFSVRSSGGGREVCGGGGGGGGKGSLYDYIHT